MNAEERKKVDQLMRQAKDLRAKAARETNPAKRQRLLRQVERLMEIAGTYTPAGAQPQPAAGNRRSHTPAEKAELRQRLEAAMRAGRQRREATTMVR